MPVEGASKKGLVAESYNPQQEDHYPGQHDLGSVEQYVTSEEMGNVEDWEERFRDAAGISSPVAESFKRLRNQITHYPKGPPPKSILFISAMPKEGKSFACANLGVSLARGVEQHALMVDCDLRRPTIASLFGLPNSNKGLVNHLRDGADLSLLIRPTNIPKLSLLPAGKPPTNPAELLGSNRMTEMIQEVVSRYPDRYVLLDSPPSMVAAETSVLANHVDGVVLIVRWGFSPREQVKQLIDTIGREKIIGVVFNAFQVNELEKKLYAKGYHGYYAGNYYSNNGTVQPS